MAGEKPDVLLVGQKKPVMIAGLGPKVNLHCLADAKDQDAFIKSVAGNIRAIAIAYTANKLDAVVISNNTYIDYYEDFPWIEQKRISIAIINGAVLLLDQKMKRAS